MRELKRCPICRRIPEIEYCCGEYFLSMGDESCACCGLAFTEMYSSENSMIDSWNRRAESYNITEDIYKGKFFPILNKHGQIELIDSIIRVRLSEITELRMIRDRLSGALEGARKGENNDNNS